MQMLNVANIPEKALEFYSRQDELYVFRVKLMNTADW